MYVQGMLKRLMGGKKGKARTVQSVTSLHKYSAVPIPECSSHNTIVLRSWSLSTDHTPGWKWHQKQKKMRCEDMLGRLPLEEWLMHT